MSEDHQELNYRIESLEKEIDRVKRRNLKVEADKAWETSLTRKLIILILTYFVTSIVFYLLGSKDFLLLSIIPTIAFLVSTFSIGFAKNYYLRK